jgi:hypothetical protein
VSKFAGGFLTASLIWGLGMGLWASGVFEAGQIETSQVYDEDLEDAGVVEEDESGMRRRRRGRRGQRDRRGRVPTGNATTGDDLGNTDRNLDLGASGGEEQLTSAEIEQGMDGVFGRIRRCLVLAAGDEPVSGRVTFGLRIEPNGSVSRARLSGPAVVTTGDAGSCLRTAVRGARFGSFDGPPMVVNYPITLD